MIRSADVRWPPGRSQSLLQHCLAFCLELASRFPFREFVAISDLVADFEQQLNILHGAGEIPPGINFIGRLMIMFRYKFIALLFSIFQRFAYDLDTARCVQHWYTGFRKFETVDPIEAALLRFTVWLHHTPLSRCRLA